MRGYVALVVAVVLGLVAVFGIRSLLVRQRQAVASRLRQTKVLAAKEPIKRGTRLRPDMVQAKEISENSVTADHILVADSFYVNQMLDRNLERGEVILRSYFREASVEVGTTLPPGQVAATIRVDDVAGVAGLIRPGDHVDLIATLPLPVKAGGGGGEVVTRRLLTNCTVLAVDNRTTQTMPAMAPYGRGAAVYSTVTLALTPKEATLIAFVGNEGKVTLALRNRTDPAEPEEPPEIGLQNVRDEAARANEERKKSQQPAALPAPAGP